MSFKIGYAAPSMGSADMLSIRKLKVSEKNLIDVHVRTSFSSSPRLVGQTGVDDRCW